MKEYEQKEKSKNVAIDPKVLFNHFQGKSISWKTIEDRIAFVKYYSQFGMDCTHISGNKKEQNSFKNPSAEYNANGIEDVDWRKATGIGINLGKASSFLRCIDIDGFDFRCREQDDKQYYETRKSALSFFIHKCLQLLGLPDNYEWLIKTPNGYHILFYAPDFGFDFVSITPSKQFGKRDPNNNNPYNTISIKGIDLLWNTHLIMPPTTIGIKEYTFINGLPNSNPIDICVGNVFNFVNYFCGTFEYNVFKDIYGCPIVYNAYYFPYYKIDCNSQGSFIGSSFMYNPNADLTGNNKWLMECNNSAGYNTLGISLIKQDIEKNGKIIDSVIPASLCFQKANDSWGNYNLACMMALGLIEGDIDKLHDYLDLAIGFPDNHKDSLIIQYLARNSTYAIINSVVEHDSLSSIFVLVVDKKGRRIKELSFDNRSKKDIVLTESMKDIFDCLKDVYNLVGINIHKQVLFLESELKKHGLLLDTFLYNFININFEDMEILNKEDSIIVNRIKVLLFKNSII